MTAGEIEINNRRICSLIDVEYFDYNLDMSFQCEDTVTHEVDRVTVNIPSTIERLIRQVLIKELNYGYT